MPDLDKADANLNFLSAKFKNELVEAADLIRNTDEPIRVISHYDADGISAAGIMAASLNRIGKLFHLSMITSLDETDIDRFNKEENKLIIFMDMGSGQIELIQKMKSNIIILDHHTPQKKVKTGGNVVELNCHKFGINGTSEASAATLAFILSLAVDEKNWDLVDLAFAGALGDKQHLEGLKGLNADLISLAEKKDLIKSERGLALFGKNLLEGITNSINPFIKDLSGKPEAVMEFLGSLRIDHEIDPYDMSPSVAEKLGSLLILKLLEQGVRPEIAEEILAVRYYSVRRRIDIEDLSHIINSCGRMNMQGIGLAVCLGDKVAFEEALKIRSEYKSEIRKGMLTLAETEIDNKTAIQFIYTDNPKFAGTYAGLGMQYIFDQNRPIIALTKLEDETKISGRGTLYLVKEGLDLASALHTAAVKLNGVGGGHPVAAGASIPRGTEEKFLDAVDKIVKKQLASILN